MKVKTNRTAIYKLNQAELSDFVQRVVTNTFEDAAYTDIKDQAAALKVKSDAFYTALILSANRGKMEVQSKNIAKQELMTVLREFVDALDYFAKGNPLYITTAGFSLQKKRQSFTGQLLAPVDLKAKATGIPGQAAVSCKHPQPNHVRITALEWSTDMENWHNGTYPTASRFVLTGLPSRTDVHIRLCALGTSKRKSNWTEPVTTFVL